MRRGVRDPTAAVQGTVRAVHGREGGRARHRDLDGGLVAGPGRAACVPVQHAEPFTACRTGYRRRQEEEEGEG
ncbi:hypothetical protein [Streptomyces sannanensis]|uniref:hypothetical protein n=1 Tax=Streptomyces sannanensis TaxID=285536 RepID=UPI0031EFCEC8